MISLGHARCSHRKGSFVYVKLDSHEQWFYLCIGAIHPDSEVKGEGNEGELILVEKDFGESLVKQLEKL